MLMVESTVTPTTASRVKRSLSLVCGSTDEMASAAEAPQIATAPPESKPSSRGRFIHLASSRPAAIVSTTASTIASADQGPSLATWLKVMRAPRRATPIRKRIRPQKSMPGLVRAMPFKKWNERPINKA